MSPGYHGDVPGPSRAKRDQVATVWRLMLQCAMNQVGKTSGQLQGMGLTPGHMKALLMLEPGEPRSMGALAQQFACDASSMTWLVDRLEERDLVRRGALPGDRRVKTVALTDKGIAMKEELSNRLYEPPDELLTLDRNTLDALQDVLTRLVETPAVRASS